jgi:hypothetical protein
MHVPKQPITAWTSLEHPIAVAVAFVSSHPGTQSGVALGQVASLAQMLEQLAFDGAPVYGQLPVPEPP